MLIGKKVGMTQIYDDKGTMVPVTVILADECDVVQVKTPARDKYSAVQLGFGKRRAKTVSKAEAGHCSKANGRAPARILREFRVDDAAAFSVGQQIGVAQFAKGKKVDVTGISIGRGFQGTRKRHHFTGGRATHGCTTHDQPGSIGASAYPSRVIKGKRLPGHMGNVRRTVKNLTIVDVKEEQNLLLVQGSVPGARNCFLLIHDSAVPKPRVRRVGEPA